MAEERFGQRPKWQVWLAVGIGIACFLTVLVTDHWQSIRALFVE
jgi:predicted ferric reductase